MFLTGIFIIHVLNLDILFLVIVFKTDIDTFSCFQTGIFMFKLDILFNVCIFIINLFLIYILNNTEDNYFVFTKDFSINHVLQTKCSYKVLQTNVMFS